VSETEIELYIHNGGLSSIQVCGEYVTRIDFSSAKLRGRKMTNENKAEGGKTLAFCPGFWPELGK
jgi:hypothetical protein